MNDIKLGELIEGADARRDALHVAVAPVKAGENLAPGDKVQFDPSSSEVQLAQPGKPFVGVIDPFLTTIVEKGRWCWLFVHPDGVRRPMRHEWSHPAFDPPAAPLPNLEQVVAGEPGPAGVASPSVYDLAAEGDGDDDDNGDYCDYMRC